MQPPEEHDASGSAAGLFMTQWNQRRWKVKEWTERMGKVFKMQQVGQEAAVSPLPEQTDDKVSVQNLQHLTRLENNQVRGFSKVFLLST